MNVSEAKKYPKCGGEMEVGYLRDAPWWRKGKSLVQIGFGPRIYAYKCKQCSYTELWGDK